MKRIFVTTLRLLIISISLIGSSCKNDDESLIERLPPATQEGLRTFGCLVNGKYWTPAGNNGTSRLDLSYDPYYKGGAFDISAYRLIGAVDQFIVFGGANINKAGYYELVPSGTTGDPGALFTDHNACSYPGYEYIVDGNFTITRFDLDNQIISGTFEFTLARSECDTIKVTDGRFDMKI